MKVELEHERSVMRSIATNTAAAAQVVGEQRRMISQPTAAVRNADGSATVKTTIWYPATPTAETVSIDVGPADAPYMFVGRVAPDAPFASERRYPVILYSHGHNGSVRTTAWFGIALARAGYVVIAPDHPGNNMEDVATSGGALLWWLRAGDLEVALDAVANDAKLGGHVYPQRVGVSGFSLGGLTAMIALGGIFDGKLYDDYCAAHPGCAICPPTDALPIFDPEKPGYPDFLQTELPRMTDDRRIPSAKAGFIIAPLTVGLRPESLGAIEVPVTFLVGSEDGLTSPEVGAALAAGMIPRSKLVIVPGANHDSFINICSPAGIAAGYCECAVAAEQEHAHGMAIESALATFDPVLKSIDADVRGGVPTAAIPE